MSMAAVTTIPVEPELLATVLKPYREHCRYLKRATVEVQDEESGRLALARGEFEIPGSWYIDDTGHFNSIEFNLCYNQIIYTLIAQCVKSRLVPELARMTLEEYWLRQLPDVLIVEFTSTFRKAMDSRSFTGWVSIDRVSDRKKLLLLKTHCEFDDGQGGFSSGDVTLAILMRPLGDAHGLNGPA